MLQFPQAIIKVESSKSTFKLPLVKERSELTFFSIYRNFAQFLKPPNDKINW